ncbi:UMP-CMP kinase [Coemansia thaxteri]|uniref:UMP-CMP kinase n=1 Tax=Coemansia thaxteri TaxID=2663907 RepID=A0A9W8BEA7_9FUNG|nr:UMP-CMP kinase [Coemansia thaxteri]KAJ2009878.1 UMP-CMP kinase [Coemansia thaxteri]KAJ2474501.1 UMP-CMP kinase [Coemansia sp. RSA 2322]KAJ2485659.1 UMP-CMP kinase [Coemansia sp. RSA 2320]
MATLQSSIRSDCVRHSPAVVPFRVATRGGAAAAAVEAGGARKATGSRGERQPMFIGIGGGRGAGKEFTCRYIIDKVRERGHGELADRVVHLHLDDFHRELSDEDRELVEAGGAEINFDHPESFDFVLLESVLRRLGSGEPVDVPRWSAELGRRVGTRRIECRPSVVLVEGILVLFVKEVRDFMDMQVFVDVDSDTRLGRQVRAMLKARDGAAGEQQLARDALTRFLDSYVVLAKPSFEEFIWPTKRWADVIIPKGDRNNVAIELIAQRLIDLGRDC